MSRFFQFIGILTCLAAIVYGVQYVYQNNAGIFDKFFYWAGILAVMTTILLVILRIWYGKNWLLKSSKAIVLSPDLITSIDQTLQELPNPKRSTIANLGGHLIYRFTRLGMLALGLALIPICLLWQQNGKIENQNQMIQVQNERINIQNSLLEADRRSSLNVLMSNILDKVDQEIRDQVKQQDKLNTQSADTRFRLSLPLIGRIVALSKAFKPYRSLEGDTLANQLSSPERGQLFIALMGSQLDSFSQNTIVENGDFSYAMIGRANLKYTNLCKANLNGANLEGAQLQGANMQEARLGNTNLSWTNLSKANLHRAKLNGANIIISNFESANLSYARLYKSNLQEANFVNTNLSHADFTYANLHSAVYRNADLTKARLVATENLFKDQIIEAKTLVSVVGLDEQLQAQLEEERPCLFNYKGCTN